jgi:hypothetical protein
VTRKFDILEMGALSKDLDTTPHANSFLAVQESIRGENPLVWQASKQKLRHSSCISRGKWHDKEVSLPEQVPSQASRRFGISSCKVRALLIIIHNRQSSQATFKGCTSLSQMVGKLSGGRETGSFSCPRSTGLTNTTSERCRPQMLRTSRL